MKLGFPHRFHTSLTDPTQSAPDHPTRSALEHTTQSARPHPTRSARTLTTRSAWTPTHANSPNFAEMIEKSHFYLKINQEHPLDPARTTLWTPPEPPSEPHPLDPSRG